MKTIFEKETRDEIIGRVNTLSGDSKAQWGKMNFWQMAKHMCVWNEWVLGRNNYDYKQEFIGKIFGRMMLRKHTSDDGHLPKGIPAGKGFTISESEGNLELQKKDWVSLIEEYGDYSNPRFVHNFYGKMTQEQIGVFVYKHSDHHLRQFEV